MWQTKGTGKGRQLETLKKVKRNIKAHRNRPSDRQECLYKDASERQQKNSKGKQVNDCVYKGKYELF